MSDLSDIAARLGLSLDEARQRALVNYTHRLATAELNLISARDRGNVMQRHIGESLAFGAVLAKQGLLKDGTRLLDVGAGGGLPGIPIRIVWPEIELTLLESVGKKCRWMEDTCRALGLEGVTVLEGRAETLGHDPVHRGRYDLVVARAVAALAVLVEYALPFLRVGGMLGAVKGTSALGEIEAADVALGELNARIHDAPSFDPPYGSKQTVVLIEKTAETPARYPRREGLPARRPLA